MSADKIIKENDLDQLPVWTVHGANWEADVPLDGINATLSPREQADEAATQALSQFKGREKGILIRLDDQEPTPIVGATLIVHLKDTDPMKGFTPFTHILFANDGYYKESKEMAKLLLEQAEALKQELAGDEQKLAEFEETIQDLKPKPKKKAKAKVPKKKRK